MILLLSVTGCILLLTLLLQDVSACYKVIQHDEVCDEADSCDECSSYWKAYRHNPAAEYCACSSMGGTLPSCEPTLDDTI